jgi:hypothetical protein
VDHCGVLSKNQIVRYLEKKLPHNRVSTIQKVGLSLTLFEAKEVKNFYYGMIELTILPPKERKNVLPFVLSFPYSGTKEFIQIRTEVVLKNLSKFLNRSLEAL